MNGNMEEHVETSAADVLRAALDDFQSALIQTHRDTFPGKDLRYVKLKILKIQHHQERVKGMMNFSRISFYLERFAEFDSLCKSINIPNIEPTELSSFIWGPSAFILEEDSNVLNIVLDAYQKFGKRIPRLESYADFIKDRPAMAKSIAFMYHDLLQFYKQIIKLLLSRSWKKTFVFDWRDYGESFESLLSSFDEHGSVLKRLSDEWRKQRTAESLTSLAQTSEETRRRANDSVLRQNRLLNSSNELNARLSNHADQFTRFCQETMRQYEQTRIEMFRLAEREEEKRKEEQKATILTWLKTPGECQSSYHEMFLEVRNKFPETAVWILEENKMFNWMNEEIPTHSVMWLNGKKGAGKTILASTIIQQCMNIPNFKTSYFYCREHDSSVNTAAAVLKGILRQLLVHTQDPLPTCVAKKSNSPEEVLVSIDTIKSLLELFCDCDMNQFIVIDGLDELKMVEVKPIVKFWQAMADRCENYRPGKIRVLFISQDASDIRKLMQNANADIFDLPHDKSSADIDRYILAQFDSLQEKFDLTDAETREARSQISARSEGMFLYATLTMDNLFKQPNVRAIKEELKSTNIPSDLEHAYHKIIDRLERESVRSQWVMAKKIFGLLAGAKRPLKWYELQAALSLEVSASGEVKMDYHSNQLRNDIRETCGTLVQVVEKNRVEFIHSTTRFFVLRSEHLNEATIECELTTLCMNYLTLECFSPGLNSNDIGHYIWNGDYALQDYAISKWKHHLETMIETTAKFLAENPDYQKSIADALTRFLAFHKDSIVAAAEEKPPPRPRQSRLSIRPSQASPTSSQSSLHGFSSSTQGLSPPCTQQSSSRSPTPLPSQPSQLPQPSQAAPAQQPGQPVDFCQAFVGTSLYPLLLELWTHVQKHENGDYKERHKVSLPHLGESLESIRTEIEELAERSGRQRDGTLSEKLSSFYGDNHYKCQRVKCDYFHEGFSNKTALKNHSDRHDRPFQCPVSSCSSGAFGFSTNKDKDKHIRFYHPEESDQPARFHLEPTENRQTAEAKFECEICHKRFTRLSIKKDHVDAHYGERKHACETCGKRFTRANDRNRHRKIHVRKR
ncbi:hypothetical protein B0T16DRAFT_494972 [Cercophora newfieldiana]|uniref:C2H2-type domain-containing protein n=1 Tax=Cercophora newfieldiana TaxID=92897 RepID=A0AA39Y196_9PEZI|nr:hypothetical protein B0T16DRAFT_494972 [Cercophora newfieldiana]